MLRKILPIVVLLLVGYAESKSQTCDSLGQNQSSAFPVCAVDTFRQTDVPLCGGRTIPVPGCSDANYQDLNPYWYRFTCFQAGTLGFVITPEELADDYDWQIFDVTGKNLNAIYTDASMFVACNWSAVSGATGTSASATSLVNCAGFAYPAFSKMPTLKEGHTYIMLISHFSGDGQSGYDLSFGGGTAAIIDPAQPAPQQATANCSGETIFIKFNKKLKCSSLDAGGTDFQLSSGISKVVGASGVNCSGSFDMDSVKLTMSNPLPPGNYSIIIKKGKDNNTLLDNCDKPIPTDTSISFTIVPLAPTPMDSISPVQCAPGDVSLVFKKKMRCTSVAANGSDFVVTGNAGISVTSAAGDACTEALSNIIKVKLNKPIQTAGNFTITLKQGNDGNTILDECAQETPAGSKLDFSTADTVSADFSYSLNLGCVYDTFFYAHDGRNSVNEWNWTFDANGTSSLQNSYFLFDDYGPKKITLENSNGVCTDSASVNVLLDNELISRFAVLPAPQLCPEDGAQFADSSTGKIVSWYWIFGDGSTSTLKLPPLKYYKSPLTNEGNFYPTALIVKNDIGCYDTAQSMLKVYYNCYIAVPTAFTPNGDGLNDYLYPLNAYKADNLEFRVYNRWGQLVFQTKDWTKKWDGRINGNAQPAGAYIWMLRYINRDSGKLFSLKGSTVLIR